MIVGAMMMIHRGGGLLLVCRCNKNSNRRCQSWRVCTAIRSHMGHGYHHGGGGSGFGLQRRAIEEDQDEDGWSRSSPLTLGLEASETTQNILRLLESSHFMMMGGSGGTRNMMPMTAGVWHERGVRWVQQHRENGAGWTHVHAHEDNNGTPTINNNRSSSTTTIPPVAAIVPPRIWSLQFADARTALAHVQGTNGAHALLSLVRLNSPYGQADQQNGTLYNGWRIIRSVEQESSINTHHPLGVAAAAVVSTAPPSSSLSSSYAEIEALVQTYWNVEHGGGANDATTARRDLFDPCASLVTIGRAQPTTTPHVAALNDDDAWSAPSGSLLEISLDTYLRGVEHQTPHDVTKRCRDELLAIRILPGHQPPLAAAVELRVGNGAGDAVFHDHLLLGKQPLMSKKNDDNDVSCDDSLPSSWKILSKIFSVHKW